MLSVVKFFANHEAHTRNKLISRTLLKVAVIDDKWQAANTDSDFDNGPKDGDFWLVDIIKEIGKGSSRVFVVIPQHSVIDVVHILSGQYTTEDINNTLVIIPLAAQHDKKDTYYIMPIQLRRKLAGANTGAPRYSSVVISHGGATWKTITV